MKLQRMTMMASYPHVGTKDFYSADDVDALLASIRAAVAAVWYALDAERREWDLASPGGGIIADEDTDDARATLDALLSGEDA